MDRLHISGQLQTAGRVVQAVELIARSREAKLGEIASALGIHKSNALRLLETLQALDWVVVDPLRSCYRVGPALLGIGQAAIENLKLDEVLRAARVLRDLTGETVHIAIPRTERMIIVACVESLNALRVSCPLGTQDPFHSSGLGKAYLASLPHSELEHVLMTVPRGVLTPNTITDIDALRTEIHATRLRGYATDNEEGRLGVRCMGFAIRIDGAVRTAALSITGPAARWTLAAMDDKAAAILEVIRPFAAESLP